MVLCVADYSLKSDNLLSEQMNQNNRIEEGNIDAVFAAADFLVFFALTFRADC